MFEFVTEFKTLRTLFALCVENFQISLKNYSPGLISLALAKYNILTKS